MRALDSLIQDVKYGFRQLRTHPGFALAAILSLALGIGANTAMFTLVDQILLRLLPVQNPRELRPLPPCPTRGCPDLGSFGHSRGSPWRRSCHSRLGTAPIPRCSRWSTRFCT